MIALFSCSRKKNSIQDNKLYPLSELSQLRVYRDIKSLPNNLDSVYRLDLSESNLTQLPEILFKLSNLQELNISQNQISDLKGIKGLEQLQILNIGMNNFNTFPNEILELKNLKVLSLWWNDIKTLPDDFFNKNSKIEELDLSSMFEFDFETNLTKIHRFKNLRRLNLGNNQIPNLTLQFDKLDSLVVFGYIRQEEIDINDLIRKLSNCKKLKVIHLSCNHIKQLPKEIILLENLEELNLYQNELTELPIEIINMKYLKEVSLSDNPIDTMKIKEIEKKMSQTKFRY